MPIAMMKTISSEEQASMLVILQTRFEQNMHRHDGLKWEAVHQRLLASPKKLWSLSEMERTGGEPDVVGIDRKTGEYLFFDCARESPTGRRSVCYDQQALESRNKHKPENSAMQLASEMGAEILTKEQYHTLQALGDFDTKTSSWLLTPPDIREKGGAIFGDFRYGTTFIYHNGAESYYAARGFRCVLAV